MSKSTDLPDRITKAGQNFNYAVWTPNTVVQLCNVPWSNDYRDIVNFKTDNDVKTFLDKFAGPSTVVNNVTYLRPHTPVRLNIPLGSAYKYNYMRVANPAQPVGGDMPTTFYYFITDVTHISPNTTQFSVQLDVWTTFGRGVSFGRCYVERGHIGVANYIGHHENGRRFLTIPEGLDTGAAHMPVAGKYIDIANANQTTNLPTQKSGIVVVSTVDLEKSGGTIESPKLFSAGGEYVAGIPSGANMYYFRDGVDFTDFMRGSQDMPWVTQGIMAIIMVPMLHDPADFGVSTKFQLVNFPQGGKAYRMKDIGHETKLKTGGAGGSGYPWKTYLEASIPKRYQHLKKFLTFPYSSVEFTLFNGQALVMKPELIKTPYLDLYARYHLTPPNPRIAIFPEGYNSGEVGKNNVGGMDYETFNTTGSFTALTSLGEDIDFATTIANLPQVPIVNNSYMSYLASNQNQIAFQYQSAEWSQQRALTGNNLAFNQASANMGLTETKTDWGVWGRNATTSQANQTAYMKGIQGAANSVWNGIGTAVGGNPIGGVMSGAAGFVNSAVDYAITENQNNKQNAINNAQAIGINDANIANMGYVRDTNKSYADYAAQGDYQNTLAGINAKIQDTQMLQPTTSGQLAGDAFSFAIHDGFKGRIVVKRVDNGTMESIGEFWLRYGYAVNRFHMLNNISVMENFTYWKLHETNIKPNSKCPENYRTTIRGIFEKGVTVWSDPLDINTLDIGDNKPLEGVPL